ncbi:hypothetical protein D3C81_1116720 [compost metagenome]
MAAAGIDRMDIDRRHFPLRQYRHQTAIGQRRADDEIRLRDDAHAGNGRFTQHFTVVGTHARGEGHAGFAFRPVQHPAVATGRVGVGQKVMFGQRLRRGGRTASRDVGRRGAQHDACLRQPPRDQRR